MPFFLAVCLCQYKAANLLKNLLHNYDHRLRPVKYDGESVMLTIDPHLNQLIRLVCALLIFKIYLDRQLNKCHVPRYCATSKMLCGHSMLLLYL